MSGTLHVGNRLLIFVYVKEYLLNCFNIIKQLKYLVLSKQGFVMVHFDL